MIQLILLALLSQTVPPPPGLDPCVHYEQDGCLSPAEPPWSEHCPGNGPRLRPRSDGSFDVMQNGKAVARCQDKDDCPYEDAPEDNVGVYRVTISGPGYVTTAIARSDGVCVGHCNGNLRVVTTGSYPNDKTYPGRTSTRSTGQLGIELEPIHE